MELGDVLSGIMGRNVNQAGEYEAVVGQTGDSTHCLWLEQPTGQPDLQSNCPLRFCREGSYKPTRYVPLQAGVTHRRRRTLRWYIHREVIQVGLSFSGTADLLMEHTL